MQQEECSVTRGELTRLRALEVEISRLKVLTEGRALKVCLLSGAVLAGAFALVGPLADSGEALPAETETEQKFLGFPMQRYDFGPSPWAQYFKEQEERRAAADYPDQGRVEGEYP